jgi:hypothetical protein
MYKDEIYDKQFVVNMIENEEISISARVLHGGVLNPK